jgi:hypothetical protein
MHASAVGGTTMSARPGGSSSSTALQSRWQTAAKQGTVGVAGGGMRRAVCFNSTAATCRVQT